MATSSVKSNLCNLEKKMEIVQKRMSARDARASANSVVRTSRASAMVPSKEKVVVDVKKSKLSQGLPEAMRGILLGIPHET